MVSLVNYWLSGSWGTPAVAVRTTPTVEGRKADKHLGTVAEDEAITGANDVGMLPVTAAGTAVTLTSM